MKTQVVLDTECYRNYWLCMLRRPDGATKSFEMYEDHPLDRDGLRKFITHQSVEIVTFNGNSYDVPMIRLALQPGTSNETLKALSDRIITENLRPWDIEREYNLATLYLDHIDLIEVAPGDVSLKIYGGRMHTRTMQDLPIEPNELIKPEQHSVLRTYCANDLVNTAELAATLKKQIDLRRTMSAEYGFDLRSKSDAQIAEAVLKRSVMLATGVEPKRRDINYNEFRYEPPSNVTFIQSYLRDKLEIIKSAPMIIKDTGHVEMPEAIQAMEIRLGSMNYTIGIGGLHSTESGASHYSDDEFDLYDRDVVSYYPNLMLNMGMYPEAIGPEFLTVYRKILDERVAAKRSGDKVKSDVLKIVLNGTFGKTSSKYSILYNPKMMITTTLTGQLYLLMLIEALEWKDIPVVSANTDGVVIKCPKDKREVMLRIVRIWEEVTKLETEEVHYRSIHSRDVNNYFAIKTDGEVKAKGVYAEPGLQKNPQHDVCSEAVRAHLTVGRSVASYIKGCRDIRKFLTVRKVNGGAVKCDQYLGKAIRWYYAKDEVGDITYKVNGNSVPLTTGAKPLMTLPEHMPNDINYDWYISEANEILVGLGAVKLPDLGKLPRKNSNAWKENVSAGKIGVNHKGEWGWAPVAYKSTSLQESEEMV